jgi:hypothetical protein
MADQAPKHGAHAFVCPHCGVFAEQTWYYTIRGQPLGPPDGYYYEFDQALSACVCRHCEESSLWIGERLAYPRKVTAPKPHPDMPATVAKDFAEARLIANDSPAAAAALLRRAVEKLCLELDAKGKDLNGRIADLVARGLQPELQQALDYVRVTGNRHVHPGELVEGEPAENVDKLFFIINATVDRMVAFPKQMDAMYAGLPEDKRKQILKRDGKDEGA